MYSDARLNRMVVQSYDDVRPWLETPFATFFKGPKPKDIYDVFQFLDEISIVAGKTFDPEISGILDYYLFDPVNWREVSISGARVRQKPLRVSVSEKDWQVAIRSILSVCIILASLQNQYFNCTQCL